jgi:hypothetical protein
MNTDVKGDKMDIESVMNKNIQKENDLIAKRLEETKYNLEQQKKLVENIEARIEALHIRQEMMVVCKRQLDNAVKHVEEQVRLSIQREHEAEKKREQAAKRKTKKKTTKKVTKKKVTRK